MLYGETGCTELSVLIQCRAINFWYNIITGRKLQLSYLMLKLDPSMKILMKLFIQSRLSLLKELLMVWAFSHLWTDNPEHISRLWVKKCSET